MLALVGFVLYLNTLPNEFIFDDAGGSVGRAVAGDDVIKRCGEGVDVRPGALLFARVGILLVGAVARFDECADGTRVLGKLSPGRTEVDQNR